MDRPQRLQRNIQPIERLRPNNQPVQPRRQAAPVQQAPVQAAPRQAPRQQRQRQGQRQPRRELNLRLTKVEAGMYDIGDPDSEFWDMYFDKPNDEITDRLDALDYADIKFNTVALQSGITNYDLKNIDTVPLKPVSFEKFKVGDYHDGRSNSDMKVYAGRIRGMTNKYDEFAQYKNQDDLLWIVRRNRELMCNILEYHITENNSASAIEAELVAMLRIIYLAFESKLTPLYLKYQAIIADMKKETLGREYDNSFNEAELDSLGNGQKQTKRTRK